VDEAMLRRGRLAHRVAILADYALSIGVGVPDGAAYVALAHAEGRAVVRRTSGGTAILHAPGDLVWSRVLPRTDPRTGADFVAAYDRLGAAVVATLRAEGLRAEWTASPGLSDEYCLLGARGSVLAVDGRILGGAAQHVTGRALLHHGVIPFELERGALARIFRLTPPSGFERLTSLRELGVTDAPEEIGCRLSKQLDRATEP
jgi:lipoate-protein ligase A